MKRLVLVLALLVSSELVSSHANAGSSQSYGKGGYIAQFQPVIDQYNSSGELMRIEGHCQSLCTMFVGLRNVCIERCARLLFHAGHDRQRNISAVSTNRMLGAYNGSLRQYLASGGYMDTLAFHTIPGATMIDRFGYKVAAGLRACKPRNRACRYEGCHLMAASA